LRCHAWTRQEHEIGTIEAGNLADILVEKTNPIQGIRSLVNNDNIAFMMRDDRVVKIVGTNQANSNLNEKRRAFGNPAFLFIQTLLYYRTTTLHRPKAVR
jgi:hypothetical protein